MTEKVSDNSVSGPPEEARLKRIRITIDFMAETKHSVAMWSGWVEDAVAGNRFDGFAGRTDSSIAGVLIGMARALDPVNFDHVHQLNSSLKPIATLDEIGELRFKAPYMSKDFRELLDSLADRLEKTHSADKGNSR